MPVRSDPGARDAGNTLVLMPIAILIVIGLAAVTVDSAAAFLGQRRLSDLAAGLAGDAVAAIDERAFYEQGRTEVVASRVLDLRDRRLATIEEDRSLTEVRCDDVVVAGDVVTVGCRARVRPIFGVALPGGRAGLDIEAVATARSVPR